MTSQAIIFDLDGTLLDTIADIGGAMNRVLERHNLPSHPMVRYRELVGWGVQTLVERCIPADRRTPEVVKQCTDEMKKEYGSNPVVSTTPYEGIPSLLTELEKRGTRFAILSNKLDPLVQTIVSRLLGRWNFSHVQGQTAGFPQKPDPSSALHVAQLLERKPDDVIYVGDTAIDMETARAAGMYAVGVSWGFREITELHDAGSHVIINSPDELLEILDARESRVAAH